MNDEQPTEREIAQSHIIDDLATELGRYKRANRTAMDLLTDALHAIDNDRKAVATEFVERASEALYGVKGTATPAPKAKEPFIIDESQLEWRVAEDQR